MEIDSIIALVGIAAAIISSAKFLDFKNKFQALAKDFGELGRITYAFVVDLTDGDGKCDMAQAEVIKKKIEHVWLEAESIAPLVKDILNQIPKKKV